MNNYAQANAGKTAPGFEEGELSEIKEKHKVYVFAYRPYQSQNIAKILKKYQSVQIVGRESEADYVILFDVERSAIRNGTLPSAAGLPPSTETAQYFAHLWVYLPSKTAKSRIVWEKRSRYLDSPRIDTVKKELTWYEPLEKSLINNFLQDLKDLRGEK